jgi:hypothetical protein
MMDYRLKKQMIFEVNTTSSSLKTCSVDHSFKARMHLGREVKIEPLMVHCIIISYEEP